MTRHMKVKHTFVGYGTITITKSYRLEGLFDEGDYEQAEATFFDRLNGDQEADVKIEKEMESSEHTIDIVEEVSSNQEA